MRSNLSLGTGRFFCLECSVFPPWPPLPLIFPFASCVIFTLTPSTSVPSSARVTTSSVPTLVHTSFFDLDYCNGLLLGLCSLSPSRGRTQVRSDHFSAQNLLCTPTFGKGKAVSSQRPTETYTSQLVSCPTPSLLSCAPLTHAIGLFTVP